MTGKQKQQIETMRASGDSYAAIANALGVSENTIKSYCRRNGLATVYIKKEPATKSDGVCDCCGKPLTQTPGAKKKRFCSDKCRLAWWAKHPEAMNRKAVYRFVCPTCGTEFEAYGNANRRYCSRACSGMARRACHE